METHKYFPRHVRRAVKLACDVHAAAVKFSHSARGHCAVVKYRDRSVTIRFRAGVLSPVELYNALNATTRALRDMRAVS
jgi:hypothetical protein